MYKLKQVPEDFIVREVGNIRIDDSGKYLYFILKKRNYNTSRAIQTIAEKLGINEKSIGFAGNKDKNAITEQAISIYNGSKGIEGIKLKDITLKYLGRGNEEIYIGSLKSNEFVIAIRNLTKKEAGHAKEKVENKKVIMPNYFGRQRLSSNNSPIGKALIKNNFKDAIGLILKSNSDCNEKIEQHLQKQKNDFVGALKIVPLKLLKLYIHSYQSFLFNKTLEQYIYLIKNGNKKGINNKKNNGDIPNVDIPLIGFATEISNKEIDKIIKKIMEEESLGFRDFITRAMPHLSSEGGERKAFAIINDLEIINEEKDELNENKEKIIVKFSLPKGSYATVLVDYLFS